MPHAIWDEREEVRKAVEAKSVNAMFVGGMLYWMLSGCPHVFTNAILDLSEEAQDEVIAGIIRRFRSGEAKSGTFFNHRMEDAVETVAADKNIDRQSVMKQMIEDLRKEGKRKK